MMRNIHMSAVSIHSDILHNRLDSQTDPEDRLSLLPFRTRKPRAQLHPFRNLSLFATLTTRELRVVESMLHYRNFRAGEVVFDEGDEGQALYIVLEGRVAIQRVRDNLCTTIAEMAEGSFFGDQALLDNSPRSAQARAISDARLAVFFRADFTSLLSTHAVIGYKIALELARHMSQRLRSWMNGAQPEQHS